MDDAAARPRSGRLQGSSRDRNPRERIPVLRTEIALVINGETRELEVEGRTLLVHALRDGLGLTGTHVGCDTSQCGACTVLLGGRAVKSCTVLALQADGAEVTTIEGLASGDGLHPLQQAFVDHHGLQCGFCTPGMILTAADLLAREPDPDDETIRRALRGNYCRCTGYQTVVESVRAAGAALRSRSAA
jgi:carbon-monoxide dehydrogenase small subunit